MAKYRAARFLQALGILAMGVAIGTGEPTVAGAGILVVGVMTTAVGYGIESGVEQSEEG